MYINGYFEDPDTQVSLAEINDVIDVSDLGQVVGSGMKTSFFQPINQSFGKSLKDPILVVTKEASKQHIINNVLNPDFTEDIDIFPAAPNKKDEEFLSLLGILDTEWYIFYTERLEVFDIPGYMPLAQALTGCTDQLWGTKFNSYELIQAIPLYIDLLEEEISKYCEAVSYVRTEEDKILEKRIFKAICKSLQVVTELNLNNFSIDIHSGQFLLSGDEIVCTDPIYFD